MDEQVWNDFMTLPADARRQAADFIAFLRQRYARTQGPETKSSLNEEPFVGMWKDRTDMTDSTEWVRERREKEWTR